MLVEADRTGCLREVLVIAAALSIQDPRERPAEQRQAADAQHAPVRPGRLGLPRLPAPLELRPGAAPGAHRQPVPARAARRVPELPAHPRVAGPARPAAVGRAQRRDDGRTTSTPLPSHPPSRCWPGCSARSGCARPRRASSSVPAAPGSWCSRARRCAKKPPRWVMAAELVETSRLWARTVARIQPEWVEPLAGHLVKRTYSEPHWSRKRGGAVAVERVTLHGIPIVVGRTVDLRPDRPRAGPRAVPPARAGGGRLGHPARVLRGEPGTARRRRGAGDPGATARPGRRRGHAVRLLRRACPGRGRLGSALRHVVEEDRRRRPGPARPHRGVPHDRGCEGARRVGVSRRGRGRAG